MSFGETQIEAVTLSGDENTDALIGSYKWASPQISYSLPDSIADYEAIEVTETSTVDYFGDLHGDDFVQFTAQQEDAVNYWISQIEAVCGVEFTRYESHQDAEATLKLANGSDQISAMAYSPNPRSFGGDIWLGTAGAAPELGNFDFFTIGHHLLHGLGLLTGHDASNPNGALATEVDAMEFSMMTYRSYVGDPLVDGYSNASGSFAQSLMMYDIAALQQLYGANFDTHSGDTTYTWDADTGQMFVDGSGQADAAGGTVFQTIWDGGGDDWFDFSNFETDLIVDLAPGSFTDFDGNTDDFAADLGDGQTASGQIYNSMMHQGDTRSLIENAVGGTGHDRIWGNEINNTLWGGDGSDKLSGNDGNDTINGGQGNDTIWGGAGKDTLKGGGWKDVIYGGTDNDFIYGQNGADELRGEKGWDKIWGGNGGDWILGENGDDELYGEDGDDALNGGWGDDYLEGNEGNDFISGGQDSDILDGGWGDDTLNGNEGIDILTGGEGADQFVFTNMDLAETDTITDFELGIDLIKITGIGFADLDISSNQNGGTLIAYDAGQIELLNLDANFLSESDFLFV